ncbi:MAG TPA: cobalamin B12-binding domain-containing protein [Petrotogaceae bacterium]|jgi:methylmalonyl-CoA mutase C-terminal domain/subunit|nr:cobalamin B12-binding domain-containing protein [Petrotogaceae bacterium]HNV06529.1 cobalamin B12-binding domain-containing protein [Petrotogaceae bacterium]HNY36515.1 cobalamin B12-binding domain-containing protein [Petrotogaceae bacterium]HOG34807.1 cobalamin B12-binding domain-containing protein [Petrotogaceae bacterium]HOT31061.1 cobalamin B12-binding domain-containing protein [Petrotogaceae bacterium]
MEKRIRVVVGKPGLDGHDRGSKVVARALRDAGMEVIYTGIRQTPEEIVNTVLQEDADILGLSILSGAHMKLCQKIIKLMKEKEINVPIFLGGIIPADDIPELKKMGVNEVFGPGTSFEDIIKRVKEIVLGTAV